ncbi:hypothetical protein ACIQLJ_14250 [Microbacterium sp. NPDC091313]
MPDVPLSLVWLHRPGDDVPAPTAVDVLPVALGAVPLRSDRATAIEAVRSLIGARWLVGGSDAAADVVAALEEEVLSGRAPAFGFAGTCGAGDLDALAARVAGSPAVPASWARLIASDRVDVEVRALLARRALPDDPEYTAQTVDAADLALLRELADVLVPQEGAAIDLAARVDAQYAAGEGDGWRFAELPPDPEALASGLATLRAVWPAETEARHALIEQVVAGEAETSGAFDAGRLAAWLEDVRVDLVRQWLAHPASMARIGYDGFATGGVVLPLRGFDSPASRREAWEPDDVATVPA